LEADITTNTTNEITKTNSIHCKPSKITSPRIRKESTQAGSNNGPAKVSQNGRSNAVLATIAVVIEADELYLEQNINRSVSDIGHLATAEEQQEEMDVLWENMKKGKSKKDKDKKTKKKKKSKKRESAA